VFPSSHATNLLDRGQTWAAEELSGDVKGPRLGVQSLEVGAQRVVVADGGGVVDAGVAQQ